MMSSLICCVERVGGKFADVKRKYGVCTVHNGRAVGGYVVGSSRKGNFLTVIFIVVASFFRENRIAVPALTKYLDQTA